MEMVRVTLTDGTKREMTKDEMSVLSLEGMQEALDGKAVINVEFFEESDT